MKTLVKYNDSHLVIKLIKNKNNYHVSKFYKKENILITRDYYLLSDAETKVNEFLTTISFEN